jgi:transposase
VIPPAKRGGRPREVDVRAVLNAILYVLSTGCQWQGAAKGFAAEEHRVPLFPVVGLDGTLERIHHALYVAVREQAGRQASPSVAIIDSQRVKAAQKGVCARPAGL